ncbi:MAG TPA: Asp-tRNA(Asn)/Glu-tRNA(Gln) amidotransferase subunit GatB [Acidimicrobiales bacterium]|nr:Asp-tRNA(Asn)/Glu-tRNA(Gln) amidotransferase subunit GatB [Acidimicrobiales bacterium]
MSGSGSGSGTPAGAPARAGEAGVEGYEIVVGLEVHCELATATKLFCGCTNAFGALANTHVCPVCLGLPGSLPVLNRRAVELAIRIGRALHCEVRPSTFHRKNYFYPDMPKDYQISQYDEPINVDGYLELPDGLRVGIERAHIEEDTGKTTHVGGGGRIHDADYSLVDYNRAGVPLVEIVSRPDVRGAEQARAYVSELRAVLVASGASDGRMEEGSLRVDANVSVRPLGSDVLGTRCEVKNLNSLRSLGRAIEHEAARQVALLESGGRVVQETRHWNEAEGRTSSMRSKEEANDYRYFSEPDLVPLIPDADLVERATVGMPLMPAARRKRVAALVGDALGGEAGAADQVATVVDLGLDDLVVAAVGLGADPSLALRRAANEAAQRPEEARRLDATAFSDLLGLEMTSKLSSTQAKTVLAELLDHGGEPEEIARRLGYEALSFDELAGVVDDVIAAHPAEWERFLGGESKVAQLLTGQVMKATKGRANGRAVAEALEARRG